MCCGATTAHPYPFYRGLASMGPLRDCTSLTQRSDHGATATRSQCTERSVTTSKLGGCTPEGLLRCSTTTRLLHGGVAAVQLCDRGAAVARPQHRSVVATQRSNAVAMQQRRAVVMQRGSAGMMPHCSAVVTQLVSAVMTQIVIAVVTLCWSAVVTQRGSRDVTELRTHGESESKTRLCCGVTTTTALSLDVTKLLQRDVGGF